MRLPCTFSKAEEYRGFHDRYRNNSEFILSCITPPTSKVLANQFLPEEDRFELDPLVGLGISRSFIDSSFHRLNNTSSASALDRKVRSNEPASSSSNVFFRDGDVDAKRPVYARAKHDAGKSLQNTTAETSLQKQINDTTGVNRPELPKKLKDFRGDQQSLSNWPQAEQYTRKLIDRYGMPNYADSGAGLKWTITEGDHTYTIRIDKGQPGHIHPSQAMDHLAITYQNKVVDNTGLNYIMKPIFRGYAYKNTN